MGTFNGNGNGRQNFSWLAMVHKLPFALNLLAELGYSAESLTGLDHNPITDALANQPGDGSPGQLATGSWAETMTKRWGKEFNRTSLSKLATLCQMFVFDNSGGPEQDNKPKALRRHWYSWYKTKFAQPFAYQLGDFELTNGVISYNDIAWAQRLSQTYAWYVDNAQYQQDICPQCESSGLHYWGALEAECDYCQWTGDLEAVRATYKDLWVEDASRMMSRTHQELFRNANIIVAVEKDSLFSDFESAAKSLGAMCIISGKGKSSKAAIELMLDNYFGWTPQLRKQYDYQTGDYQLLDPVFTADQPIHVIHVSDHDYDGQAVIGPTFAEQIKRYTPHVKEARVGIKPEDLAGKGYAVQDQMYSVKLKNKGYQDWAANQALFIAECVTCGNSTLTKGTDEARSGFDWPGTCGHCGGSFVTIKVTGSQAQTAYGLEVEAMRTADYRDLLVKALLTILDFDYIVEQLREQTLAYDQLAAERARDRMLENNDSYQDLLKEFEELERKKLRFENAVMYTIWPVTAALADAYPHQGEDPMPADYSNHVERLEFGSWNPFSADIRTNWLVEDLQQHIARDLLYGWEREYIEDYDTDEYDYIDTSSFNN